MADDVAIRVENISKRYTLGSQPGEEGLRHVLQNAIESDGKKQAKHFGEVSFTRLCARKLNGTNCGVISGPDFRDHVVARSQRLSECPV